MAGIICSSARCWSARRRARLADLAGIPIIKPTFKADPARHGCRSDTVIAVNFTEKMILIGNTEYSGEMKKGVFGLLNFRFPRRVDADALQRQHRRRRQERNLLGLSRHRQDDAVGRSSRTADGDDEHGWSDTAVFNFEGGC